MSTAVAIIAAVATPATVALSAYQITGDPTLRPLGVTIEKMVEVAAPPDDLTVKAELHLADTETETALRFARQIDRAFLALGHDPWVVVLRDPRAGESHVIYRVGRNTFGPYALQEAAQGVRPAITAIRSTLASRGAPSS